MIVPIGGDIGYNVIEEGANETIDSRGMEQGTRIWDSSDLETLEISRKDGEKG